MKQGQSCPPSTAACGHFAQLVGKNHGARTYAFQSSVGCNFSLQKASNAATRTTSRPLHASWPAHRHDHKTENKNAFYNIVCQRKVYTRPLLGMK